MTSQSATLGHPAGATARLRRQAIPSRADNPRRNEYWRYAHDQGQIDHRTGLKRRFSVRELAEMWGVTRQTVHRGIASARATREAIDDAAMP